MNTFHHLRAWLLNRQADQLMQRAISGRHCQSAHQIGSTGKPERISVIHNRPWFALAALTVAFGAGYVVADDARIESDRDQVSALCAQPWPDAPGAIEARRRACPLKTQS